MTAYASSQEDINKLALFTCEIKAVNSRFLDINFKLPDFLNFLEPEIRKALSGNFKRGKIEVFCTVKLDQVIKLDRVYTTQIREYLALYNNIKKLAQESGAETQNLLVTDLIKDITSRESSKQQIASLLDDQIKKDIENNLLELINKTIINLAEQRKREGVELQAVLLDILNLFKQDLTKLEGLLPKTIEQLQSKYKLKLQDSLVYLTSNTVSELNTTQEQELQLKIAQEAVAYVNKIDINEELARLKVHLCEVESVLNHGGIVGRKLDFLMQELTREANTLSAKSVDIEFRNIAINLKVYIEQMREQIQNIE